MHMQCTLHALANLDKRKITSCQQFGIECLD